MAFKDYSHDDCWSDQKRSADPLAERHHGRKQLIERMVNATSGSKRRKEEVKTGRAGLAMGYEVMEIRDEGDEGGCHLSPEGCGGWLTFLRRVSASVVGALPALVPVELHEAHPDCTSTKVDQRELNRTSAEVICVDVVGHGGDDTA